MTQITIVVTGVADAKRRLSPEAFEANLRDGLQEGGDLVAAEMRRIIQPHRFRGRWQQELHTEVSGSGLGQKAHIGVSAAAVPEARPMTLGWKSGAGKRPPTSAIEEWLERAPNAPSTPTGMTTRGFAFLIARAIGRRGYSFGSGSGGQKLDTNRRAWAAAAADVKRAIARNLAKDR